MYEKYNRMQRGFTVSRETSDAINQIAIDNGIGISGAVDMIVSEYIERHDIKPSSIVTNLSTSRERLDAIKAKNVLRHKKLAKGRKTAM